MDLIKLVIQEDEIDFSKTKANDEVQKAYIAITQKALKYAKKIEGTYLRLGKIMIPFFDVKNAQEITINPYESTNLRPLSKEMKKDLTNGHYSNREVVNFQRKYGFLIIN